MIKKYLFVCFLLAGSAMFTYASYEAEFQSRADSIYDHLTSVTENNLSWAPEHVMAKVIAHFERGEDATADDLLENGNHGDGYHAKQPFHFTYYSSVQILYQYPQSDAVLRTKKDYVQQVWDRNDSYNIWTGEGTENHINMSRTSGYLYALLARDSFPGEFSNPDPAAMVDSMKNWIAYHSKKILEVGSGEWNSSQYGAYNIIPWITLYDFSPDDDIKAMAKAVCDYYASEIALHYSYGLIGGAETRRSGGWNSTTTQTAYLAWLWYGNSPRPNDNFWVNAQSATQAGYAASSSYRPPEIARKLAAKTLTYPAYYQNSKPSYWLDKKSFSKQHFYIDKDFTLGTGYLPFGGWSGADYAYVTWKMVSRPESATAEYATGNGMYYSYKRYDGGKIDPFTQVVQHENVLIELSKVPESSLKDDIETAIDGIFTQWKSDWTTDFDLRFPLDNVKGNPVDDGLSGFRSNRNGTYIRYSGTASATDLDNDIFFVALNGVYLAIRSVAQQSPSAPAMDGSDYYVTDEVGLDTIAGLIMEVKNVANYVSLEAFKNDVINNTSLVVDLDNENIVYTSLDNDVIDVTFNDYGTAPTTIFDWGYGATKENGYVIQSSPPFVQPDWPEGKGYGRLADWSVNGTPVNTSVSEEWSVYEGPNLKVNNGILLLEDNAGSCYQIDYSNDVPVFSNSCDISTMTPELKYENISDARIKIYPNPAKDIVYVTGIENVVNVAVINLQGQVVAQKEVVNGKIDISDINPGYYIFNFQGETVKVLIR